MPQMTNFQAETETGNVVPKKINQTIQQEAKCRQLLQMVDSFGNGYKLWQLLLQDVHSFNSCHKLLTALIAVTNFDSCY